MDLAFIRVPTTTATRRDAAKSMFVDEGSTSTHHRLCIQISRSFPVRMGYLFLGNLELV